MHTCKYKQLLPTHVCAQDGLPGVQAWCLRRMITVFNGICGRPHVPKETNIREMLERLGIKLPEKAKRQVDDNDDDDDGSPDPAEEGAEEEPPTDDEECTVLTCLAYVLEVCVFVSLSVRMKLGTDLEEDAEEENMESDDKCDDGGKALQVIPYFSVAPACTRSH